MQIEQIYSYKNSTITHSKISTILQELSDILKVKKISTEGKRRVYAIVSEGLENIDKHGSPDKTIKESIQFSVLLEGSVIWIITKNLIANEMEFELKKTVAFFNSLRAHELKPFFLQIIKEKSMNIKGGAGVGLIIMKRKADFPLEIEFEKISDKKSFVTITVKLELDTMKTFKKSATKHTPEIFCNIAAQQFIITGQSRPENADDFYQGIINWVESQKEAISNLSRPLLQIDLEYFNSTSLKNILRLLRHLLATNHDNFRVEWFYDKDDESAKEEGIELSEVLKKKFVFIEK